MRRQLIALGMLCGLLPGFVVHTHAAEAPAVSAASAVLMDAETGRVLYAHNEQEPRAIASTTKLMTALVAAEYLGGDLSETVEIKREWTGIEGTSLYLKPGETITLKTLLYGLLLHSGNDAAVALAGICGGEVETFVGWMNQRAQDLGMTNTHFSDPTAWAMKIITPRPWIWPSWGWPACKIPRWRRFSPPGPLPWRGGSSPTTISSCGSMRAAPA